MKFFIKQVNSDIFELEIIIKNASRSVFYSILSIKGLKALK